ncbi:MAG: hypothetical protein FJ388_18570 [Verrucomicrobia bacterium]|nr:hypothetical protein [Verrucomicrobiota bacterium]
MNPTSRVSRLFAAACLVTGLAGTGCANAGEGVSITDGDGKLTVKVDGQLFTEYYFKDVPRPFFYPIIGPGGIAMTRNYPMKTVEGEDQDHPHHRSLWYAHGDVNGVDCWAEAARKGGTLGKTLHRKFLEKTSGKDCGVIRTENEWVGPEGKVLCTDERTLRIYPLPGGERMLDFEITFKATQGELKLGDTKEGSMSIRVPATMSLKSKVAKEKAQGHIINSEGHRDDEAWGKRAKWCDYYGPVEGKVLGVAVFDHPKNPRHPTWWHARNYGLCTANPFGIHDFEKGKPKGEGDLIIPAGKSATFRYRFVFHKGDEKEGKVAERYQEYAAGK